MIHLCAAAATSGILPATAARPRDRWRRDDHNRNASRQRALEAPTAEAGTAYRDGPFTVNRRRGRNGLTRRSHQHNRAMGFPYAWSCILVFGFLFSFS